MDSAADSPPTLEEPRGPTDCWLSCEPTQPTCSAKSYPPEDAAKFEAGLPKPLFDTRLGNSASFDVSKDGRFLIPTQLEQAAMVPMTVVVNWTQALVKK